MGKERRILKESDHLSHDTPRQMEMEKYRSTKTSMSILFSWLYAGDEHGNSIDLVGIKHELSRAVGPAI